MSDLPKVSVIIPACNEQLTIAQAVREAKKVHPQTEVIVVANGCKDGTPRIASQAGARVLHYAQRLGHDVGRSLGAMAARGDIFLFTDADFAVSARDLAVFASMVEKGFVDIALNSYLGPTDKTDVHHVILSKHVLNVLLGRADLRGASLTTIPHAMSRKAAETIGMENLAVPPKAQALAQLAGLRMQAVHFVHVGKRNRRRVRSQKKQANPLETLIVGDHLEAAHLLAQIKGRRGGFTDLSRARHKLRW